MMMIVIVIKECLMTIMLDEVIYLARSVIGGQVPTCGASLPAHHCEDALDI